MRSNDDVHMYRTARKVLDGGHVWLEEGAVGLQELTLEGYWESRQVEAPQPEAEPAGAPAGGPGEGF
jgi:hypothetical protein